MNWAALAKQRGLVLQVGHLERFSAAYQAMAGKIGAPLYIEATRIAPFKPRGTDVSVILDLMIHDLDLVLALVDSEIESVDAVGAPVASPHEDIANARLRFRNGAVATITASRISPRTERRMRIFAQNAYMAVDFAARKLTVILANAERGWWPARRVSSRCRASLGSASRMCRGRNMTRWRPNKPHSPRRCWMARRCWWMPRWDGERWRRLWLWRRACGRRGSG